MRGHPRQDIGPYLLCSKSPGESATSSKIATSPGVIGTATITLCGKIRDPTVLVWRKPGLILIALRVIVPGLVEHVESGGSEAFEGT